MKCRMRKSRDASAAYTVHDVHFLVLIFTDWPSSSVLKCRIRQSRDASAAHTVHDVQLLDSDLKSSSLALKPKRGESCE